MAFEVLFHLFAELNIGYAGVESFSAALDGQIFKAAGAKSSEEIEKEKDRILFKCRAVDYEPDTERLNELRGFYSVDIKAFDAESEHFRKFTKGFKVMFVNSGLYCIAILFLLAHEHSFAIPDNLNTTFLFLDLSVLFNIYIFIRSFRESGLDDSKSISWVYSVSFLVFLFGISTAFCFRCPLATHANAFIPANMIYDVSLFVAMSPYLLHILRISLGEMMLRRRQAEITRPVRRELKKIQKQAELKSRIDLLIDRFNLSKKR